MESGQDRGMGQVGQYELLGRIGAGGMGAVYRARDMRTGAVVALKLMHDGAFSDPSAAERFRREAQVSALLDSPHIVRMLEFNSDGRPFIVSELVEGPSVADLLRAGPLDAGAAAGVGAQVAAALEEAARRGVVHRDIKPGNILVAPGSVAKVTDFGIAMVGQSSSLTMPGLFVGTAAYSAPEQHRGLADIRSDIYSLGVVLFEMLTGHLPYEAATATGMMRLHEEAPIPVWELGGVPPVLAGVVERCLQKQPERRFQSPAQLRAALGAPPSLPAAPPMPAPATTLQPAVPAGETVIAPAALSPVWAGAGATVVGGDATSFVSAGSAAAGQPLPALAAFTARIRSEFDQAPVLRRAAIGACAVFALTIGVLVGFRGSEAEQPTGGGGGRGGGGGFQVDPPPPLPSATVPTATATVTATASPSATQAPVTPTPPPPPAPGPAQRHAGADRSAITHAHAVRHSFPDGHACPQAAGDLDRQRRLLPRHRLPLRRREPGRGDAHRRGLPAQQRHAGSGGG